MFLTFHFMCQIHHCSHCFNTKKTHWLWKFTNLTFEVLLGVGELRTGWRAWGWGLGGEKQNLKETMLIKQHPSPLSARPSHCNSISVNFVPNVISREPASGYVNCPLTLIPYRLPLETLLNSGSPFRRSLISRTFPGLWCLSLVLMSSWRKQKLHEVTVLGA